MTGQVLDASGGLHLGARVALAGASSAQQADGAEEFGA